MSYCSIYITVPNLELAKELSHKLVQKRLAACATVIPGAVSTYWWQGKLETDSEVVLLLKTREKLFDEVETLVKAHHPYDLPCIVALPIVNGSAAFLEWIEAETTLN